MSDDKYTAREKAFVTYLKARDTGNAHEITRRISEANAVTGRTKTILIKFDRIEPAGQMNNNDQAGYDHRFILICVATASDSDTMDTQRNEMLEFVDESIRATTAYTVFNSVNDGHPLGWRIVSTRKGVNRDDQLVVEIEVSVMFMEDEI